MVLELDGALFEPSHMRYNAERVNDTAREPSLADMVEKAIIVCVIPSIVCL